MIEDDAGLGAILAEPLTLAGHTVIAAGDDREDSTAFGAPARTWW